MTCSFKNLLIQSTAIYLLSPAAMKTVITIILTILTGAMPCSAQTKPNSISLELGKTGLIYNLAFDHKLSKNNPGIRILAGSNFGRYLQATSAGAGVYYLVGKSKNHFEIGVDLQYLVVDEVSDDQRGLPLIYPDHSVKTFYPNLNLGYRLYGKQTLFRIGLSPGVIEGDFAPGGYIGLGVRF